MQFIKATTPGCGFAVQVFHQLSAGEEGGMELMKKPRN
ncbi:MAG: hypothetical protein ACJA0Z_002303 [Halioglobus sp.]|jgi:hypothetical protein